LLVKGGSALTVSSILQPMLLQQIARHRSTLPANAKEALLRAVQQRQRSFRATWHLRLHAGAWL